MTAESPVMHSVCEVLGTIGKHAGKNIVSLVRKIRATIILCVITLD